MDKIREKINREMRSGIYSILILKAIEDLGETYGYEIQKYVEEKSGGKMKLKDATVYPVLRYLNRKNILHAYWTEPGEGVPRKYYSLTDKGKKLLKVIVKDYYELVRYANRIIGGEK